MVKKTAFVILFLFVILNIFLVYAADPPGSSGGMEGGIEEGGDDATKFRDAANSGGSVPPQQTPSSLSLDTKLGTASIPSGSTVSVTNGDLTSSALDSADTTSDVHIKNSLSTTISKNGNVAVSSADSVKIGKIIITNPNNLKYDDATKTVEFDSALKLNEVARFIQLDNLKQSEVQLNNGLLNKLKIKSDIKQSFKSLLPEGTVETSAVKDGVIEADFSKFNSNNPGSEVKYIVDKSTLIIKNSQQKPIITAQQSGSKPEIVEIKKTDDGFITRAENSIITISTEQTDERFIGNETLFNWNINDGITFALIDSPGAYRYSYKELQQDRNGIYAKAEKTFAQGFEVSRRTGLEKYKLFIDKPSKRTTTGLQESDKNSAFISLPMHSLKLRGTITYSRVNFDYKTTPRFMGGSWWIEVLPADNSYLPIVETFNNETTANIQLDGNNIHANITMASKFSGSKAYTVFFDDISISESKDGLTRIWSSAPFIVDEFRTSTNDVFFKNILTNSWSVAQMQNNTPIIFFHSKQDETQKLFNKEINSYEDTACEDLNKKVSITQQLINYIRGLLQ